MWCNLKSHLRVHHVTEYAVLKNAELAEKKVRQSEGDNNQASTNATTLKQTQLQQSSLQTSSTKFSHDNPKQKLITEKIAQMICKDLQRYSIELELELELEVASIQMNEDDSRRGKKQFCLFESTYSCAEGEDRA